MKHVNTASWQLPASGRFGYDVIAIDGAGHARWAQSTKRQRPLVSADAIDVTLDGKKTARAEYFRFDHIPGGWLFVPRTTALSTTYRFRLDGRVFRVQRK